MKVLDMKNAIDSSYDVYRRRRMAHWDRISAFKRDKRRPGAFYHKLIQHYYRSIVPPGMRILELGCGHGHLLSHLKPSLGVGIDFSREMLGVAAGSHPECLFVRADVHKLCFKGSFDVIILSDLVNDLWDVQAVLEHLHGICHPGTRIIINFYNNMWRIPLGIVKMTNLGAETLEQNWLAPADMVNLLNLSGFEVVNMKPCILLPVDIKFAADLFNRFVSKIAPFSWFDLTHIVTARPLNGISDKGSPERASVSVIIPARNEAGNIEEIIARVPAMGAETEIIFVEGHSSDDTYEAIEQAMARHPQKNCRLFRQKGRGKGDAVRLGFGEARGEVLMILDADMTVPPEDLTRFYRALTSGKGEFINGVRLVYPMAQRAMRFFNMLGNKFFSIAFSWLLGQPVKDTLCGTKVLWARHYRNIEANRHYFGDFDPFGDFDLLFGAARLNLKIIDVPVRYQSRRYGDTNISRWRHGWLLVKMVVFAAKRIKFI